MTEEEKKSLRVGSVVRNKKTSETWAVSRIEGENVQVARAEHIDNLEDWDFVFTASDEAGQGAAGEKAASDE